jgi:hypothetical protein
VRALRLSVGCFIRHIHHTRRLCACRRQGDPACMQLTTSMSHETIFRRAANVWNFAVKFRTYSSAALHLFIYIKDRIQFQYFLHLTYRGNFMDFMTDHFSTYIPLQKKNPNKFGRTKLIPVDNAICQYTKIRNFQSVVISSSALIFTLKALRNGEFRLKKKDFISARKLIIKLILFNIWTIFLLFLVIN